MAEKVAAMNQPEILQVSFVVRFWLEGDNGTRTWRGRIIEMHDEHGEFYVRDGDGLYKFISRKLAEFSSTEFPYAAAPGGNDH
jgi:hypothetical protein